MTAKDVHNRIRDAWDRCAVAHDDTRGPFLPFAWVGADETEQVRHGTTDYALAAYLEWGPRRGRSILRARGVMDYRVADLDGRRTITGPALLLTAQDKCTIALTGASWGYGGEGPNGSALILTDAGFFPDLADALDFVTRLDSFAPWERERAP